MLYDSGVPKTESRKHDTGFIVHKLLCDSIIELKGISERLCCLKLKGKHNNQVFIKFYASNSSGTEEEANKLYKNLQDAVP